jgi:hypothetical protein
MYWSTYVHVLLGSVYIIRRGSIVCWNDGAVSRESFFIVFFPSSYEPLFDIHSADNKHDDINEDMVM